MKMFEEGNRLTTEALDLIRLHADMIDCECPTHLIEILTKVRAFTEYTKGCIKKFPDDKKTHEWLLGCSENLDSMLSATITQLARFEGFIDGENKFVARDVKNT